MTRADTGYRKDTIRMACEAGAYSPNNPDDYAFSVKELERFAELVRADEQKKWQNQAMVDIYEAVLDEREACAKMCEEGLDTEHPTVKGHIMKAFGKSSLLAAAIRERSANARARGQQ